MIDFTGTVDNSNLILLPNIFPGHVVLTEDIFRRGDNVKGKYFVFFHPPPGGEEKNEKRMKIWEKYDIH